MISFLQSLGLALLWFTRIPLPIRVQNAQALQQQSLAWLPLVGLLVGGWGAMLYWLFSGFGASLAALLAQGGILLFTGALHEDGWADGWDALGCGGDRTRRLEVLKDPRLGTFGVSGLVFSLGVQFYSLSLMSPAQAWLVLPLLHAASRVPLSIFAWTLPYARPVGEGKAGFLREPVHAWAWVVWAIHLLGLLLVLFLAPTWAIMGVGGAICACFGAVWPWWHVLRGVTGDVFGFCQQAGLLVGLLLVVRFLICV